MLNQKYATTLEDVGCFNKFLLYFVNSVAKVYDRYKYFARFLWNFLYSERTNNVSAQQIPRYDTQLNMGLSS